MKRVCIDFERSVGRWENQCSDGKTITGICFCGVGTEDAKDCG